eukprot:12912100-Heterocapsa_arctica.AAC.1
MAAQVVIPGSLALDTGTRAQKQFSAKQLAKAAQGTEHYRSCSSDIINVVKRVRIYRYNWDHLRTPEEIAQMARDGCTRWHPGKHFVEPWVPGKDPDPGLAGFIHMHKSIFELDDAATHNRHSQLTIGLMVDDIEALDTFDPNAPPLPNEMPDNPACRSCIKSRLRYFFGKENPTAFDMYAKRGMLAQE